MKKLTDQELNKVNGGYADRYFQNETLFNKNNNEEKEETKNTSSETTVSEDGSVCVSGGW